MPKPVRIHVTQYLHCPKCGPGSECGYVANAKAYLCRCCSTVVSKLEPKALAASPSAKQDAALRQGEDRTHG